MSGVTPLLNLLAFMVCPGKTPTFYKHTFLVQGAIMSLQANLIIHLRYMQLLSR